MSVIPQWTRLAMAGVLVAASAGCGAGPDPSSEPASEPGALAIVGAQLIDGTGADPIVDAVIVIRGDRIAAAGSRAETAIPAGAEIVDGAGQTVIPGLVETHAHYNGETERAPRQYRSQLYFGVTTSRSIGSDPPDKVALALDARAGRIPGPRLYTAGLGFSHQDNGFPPGRPVNRPETTEEARGLVLGLAYIFFFNHPDNPLTFIYHTMAILVISTITHFYTVSHITAGTALKQMDAEFESVSASLKQPFYITFRRVTVPVCLPVILDIAIYLFVNAMTTVSAVVFLYGPDTTLASVAVLNMDDAGDIAPAAAMGMMIFYTCAVMRIVHYGASRSLVYRTQAWRTR